MKISLINPMTIPSGPTPLPRVFYKMSPSTIYTKVVCQYLPREMLVKTGKKIGRGQRVAAPDCVPHTPPRCSSPEFPPVILTGDGPRMS